MTAKRKPSPPKTVALDKLNLWLRLHEQEAAAIQSGRLDHPFYTSGNADRKNCLTPQVAKLVGCKPHRLDTLAAMIRAEIGLPNPSSFSISGACGDDMAMSDETVR